MYFCSSRFLTCLIFSLSDWCESKIAWETPSSMERRIMVLDMAEILVINFSSCWWSSFCTEVFSRTCRSGLWQLDFMWTTLVWFSTNESTGVSTPWNVSSMCPSKSISRSSGGLLCNSTCSIAFFFGTCAVTSLCPALSLIPESVFVDVLRGTPFSCTRLGYAFVNGAVKEQLLCLSLYEQCFTLWWRCASWFFALFE